MTAGNRNASVDAEGVMPNSQTGSSVAGHIYFENQRISPRRLRRRFLYTEHSGRLHEKPIDALESDPPPEIREKLLHNAEVTLKRWLKRGYGSEKVEKLIGKIENGFDYWFTFVTHPGVESTNNRAERTLREHVVQRKIVGTLRNRKGTSIHERIMTVLATWAQQGFGQSPDDEGAAEWLNTYNGTIPSLSFFCDRGC